MKRNRISENAKAVAEDVKLKVIKGEKVVMGKIIKKHGYSDGISKQPIRVRKTKSYQNEMKPFVEKLRSEVNRIADELEKKDLSLERYKDLTDSLDKLNKNLQLAEGKPTEITKHKLSKEEREKIDNLLNDE